LLVGRDVEHNLVSAVEVDGQTTNVDLRLQAGLTLSGSVQDPAGAPVTNAIIGIMMSVQRGSSVLDQQQAAAAVDAKGAFSFPALPRGQQYNISVAARGYGTVSRRALPSETQTASLQLEPFTLQVANQKLEGLVLGTNDRPVAGAIVSARVQSQTGPGVTSDAQGHFAIYGVIEGPMQLTAYLPIARSGGPLPPGANSPASSVRGTNYPVSLLRGYVQAHGGDTNIVIKLGLTNGVPIVVPARGGPVPANGPPPAPLQP